MEQKIDGKNEFVNKLEKILLKVMSTFGKNRTEAMQWLGQKMGYSSGRKQIYNWLSQKELPHNFHAIVLQLNEIESSSLPPSTEPFTPAQSVPAIPSPQISHQKSLAPGIDSIMPYVIDLAVKYGELRAELERHKYDCKKPDEIEELLRKHKLTMEDRK